MQKNHLTKSNTPSKALNKIEKEPLQGDSDAQQGLVGVLGMEAF